MPVFVDVPAEHRAKLKEQLKPKPRRKDRQVWREHLSALRPTALLEVVPDSGETLRGVKGNLTRAAKEAGVSIVYGETRDGSLLVWLKGAAAKG